MFNERGVQSWDMIFLLMEHILYTTTAINLKTKKNMIVHFLFTI